MKPSLIYQVLLSDSNRQGEPPKFNIKYQLPDSPCGRLSKGLNKTGLLVLFSFPLSKLVTKLPLSASVCLSIK